MDDKSKPFGEPRAGFAPPPSFLEATSSAGPSRGAASFQTRFACVTLNMTDRMRFINFSAPETSALRGVLGSVWPIQEVRAYGGADEIKFKGYPWQERVNGDDNARRLIRRMLEALYDMGWVLQAAVDVSKKDLDKGMVQPRARDVSADHGHDADSPAARPQTPSSSDIRTRRRRRATG